MDSPIDNLNKYLQKINKSASLSWLNKQTGPNHEAVWTSTCKLDGVEIGRGTGKKIRHAKAAAAREALAVLEGSQETGTEAAP